MRKLLVAFAIWLQRVGARLEWRLTVVPCDDPNCSCHYGPS